MLLFTFVIIALSNNNTTNNTNDCSLFGVDVIPSLCFVGVVSVPFLVRIRAIGLISCCCLWLLLVVFVVVS